MKYFIKCQVNDDKFDDKIVGTLANANQEIEVIVHKEKANEKFVSPVVATDVVWTDSFGDLHRSHYFASSTYKVLNKFIKERNNYE